MQKNTIDRFIIASSALLLAFHGGTPFFHPDFLIDKVEHMLLNSGDPDFFHYPALMIYLNGFVYSIYDLIIRIISNNISNEMQYWPYKDIPGHALTVLFSVIAALSTYGSVSFLTKSRFYSFIGVFTLITSPLWNADAHFITVDIPLAALCALTLYFLLTVIEDGRKIIIRDIILLGILIGLTASAKYNGALIAFSVGAALFYRISPLSRSLKYICYCAFMSILTFLLTNPYIIIDFQHFINDFLYEVGHASIGHFGYSVTAMHHNISESLYNAFGGLLLIFSAAGVFCLIIGKEHPRQVKVALITFPLLHFMVLLKTKLAFQRYALPLLPFLSIFVAYALYRIGAVKFTKSSLNFAVRIISVCLILVSLGINLSHCLWHDNLLLKTDTRSSLQLAFFENKKLISQYEILAGKYTGRHIGYFPKLALQVDTNNPDIMLLDSFSHDRYIYEASDVLKLDFSEFTGRKALILSPYSDSKDEVPFSPKSLYSPYLPDLYYRTKPGPYIEVYFNNSAIAQRISKSLSRMNVENILIDAKKGYYYKAFSISRF